MRKPWLAQIFPRLICRFNESDLFGTGPSLDFLFALNRRAHFGETLKPDETVAVVSPGESAMRLLPVLEDASAQVAGHTDVERSASAGDYVCEVDALVHWWNGNETVGNGKCLRSRESARSRSFAPLRLTGAVSGSCLPRSQSETWVIRPPVLFLNLRDVDWQPNPHVDPSE